MDNLKVEVLKALVEIDFKAGERWATTFTTNTDSLSINDQLVAVNNFWRLQLGLLPFDTIDAREYLMVDVSAELWMERFKRHVIPIIVQHELPK